MFKKLGIEFGYYNEEENHPRNFFKRDEGLYLYNTLFCLLWKSQSVSFSQAIQEFETNFKIVDIYITEENVNSHFIYEFIPKKIESQLNNFNVYDLQTQNTDKAKPYKMIFYRLSKTAGQNNPDLTPYEIQKCKKDTLVFEGDVCIGNALDALSKLNRETQKTINTKIVEYNLQVHAHNR